MRLTFRRGPTVKTVQKLQESLAVRERDIEELTLSLATGQTENHRLREESRRYATELRQTQRRFEDFVLDMALEGRPETSRVDAYITDIRNLTAELVADLTEEETT